MLAVVVLANVVCAGWLGTADRTDDVVLSAVPPLDENIVLLSERPDSAESASPPEISPAVAAVVDLDAADSVVDAKESQSPSPPAPAARVCVAMGPFEAVEKAQALKATVEEAGGRAEIVEEALDHGADYLVYITSPGSRANARRMLEELQGRDVDGHIIAGGELENSLSVGVFTRERFAQAQRDRVAELGYDVHLELLPRQSTVYRLLADRVVSGVGEAEVEGCDAIASARGFL